MSVSLSQETSARRCSLRTERTETCVAVLCHTYVQNISTKGIFFIRSEKSISVETNGKGEEENKSELPPLHGMERDSV